MTNHSYKEKCHLLCASSLAVDQSLCILDCNEELVSAGSLGILVRRNLVWLAQLMEALEQWLLVGDLSRRSFSSLGRIGRPSNRLSNLPVVAKLFSF